MIKELNELKKTKKEILFVGIGNVLKRDDGVGVYITNRIKETKKIKKLTVEVSIENYIGKINKLSPDVLIIIDCLEFGKTAGYYEILGVEKVKDFTVNTHNISLKRVSELFEMPVFILGIQPEDVSFGERISDKVIQSAEEILSIIN